jgi:hypothetical protein
MADFVFSRSGDPSPEAAAYAYKQWQEYQERQKLVTVLAALAFFVVVILVAVYGRLLWRKVHPAITKVSNILISHPLALAAGPLVGAYAAIKWHLCSVDTLWINLFYIKAPPPLYGPGGGREIAQLVFGLVQGLLGVFVCVVVWSAALYVDTARRDRDFLRRSSRIGAKERPESNDNRPEPAVSMESRWGPGRAPPNRVSETLPHLAPRARMRVFGCGEFTNSPR